MSLAKSPGHLQVLSWRIYYPFRWILFGSHRGDISLKNTMWKVWQTSLKYYELGPTKSRVLDMGHTTRGVFSPMFSNLSPRKIKKSVPCRQIQLLLLLTPQQPLRKSQELKLDLGAYDIIHGECNNSNYCHRMIYSWRPIQLFWDSSSRAEISKYRNWLDFDSWVLL